MHDIGADDAGAAAPGACANGRAGAAVPGAGADGRADGRADAAMMLAQVVGSCRPGATPPVKRVANPHLHTKSM